MCENDLLDGINQNSKPEEIFSHSSYFQLTGYPTKITLKNSFVRVGLTVESESYHFSLLNFLLITILSLCDISNCHFCDYSRFL